MYRLPVASACPAEVDGITNRRTFHHRGGRNHEQTDTLPFARSMKGKIGVCMYRGMYVPRGGSCPDTPPGLAGTLDTNAPCKYLTISGIHRILRIP